MRSSETRSIEHGGLDVGAHALEENASPALVGPVLSLRPGSPLHRYTVLQVVGQGAMGVVLEAYDPQLDRRVAIKMLGTKAQDAARAAEARARLLREAQALARVRHPNVVTIHDVGTFHGEVYLAMEYVDGRTLRAWQQEEANARSWREIVALYLEVGRGLSAIHQEGLIHRDFKPENVLVDKTGRGLVADFGLVAINFALRDTPVETPRVSTQEWAIEKAADSRVTQPGSTLGTPAYMSPEQFLGATELDARSDQFSFCAALWEALYGVRPFAGQDLAELRERVVGGELTPPPLRRLVPEKLLRHLERGLSRDPSDRFPSLEPLLGALAKVARENDPSVRRARRFTAIAVLLPLGGLAVLGIDRQRGSTLCQGGSVKMQGVWNPTEASRLTNAFAAHAPDDAITRIRSRFDDFSAHWVRAHNEACEATRLRGEQSQELMDMRIACLDRELGAADALLRTLEAAPTRASLDRALADSTMVEGVGACADKDVLLAIRERVPASKATDVDRSELLFLQT